MSESLPPRESFFLGVDDKIQSQVDFLNLTLVQHDTEHNRDLEVFLGANLKVCLVGL